jgi:hypothetical protein
MLILAHLAAPATRQNMERRREQKVRVFRNLAGRELDSEDVRRWYRILDWVLDLPRDVERRFQDELNQTEKEREMTRMTGLERLGREDGYKERLLKSLPVILRLKFKTIDPDLQDALNKAELTTLERVLERVETLDTLDKVREVLTSPPPQTNGT